MNSLSIYPEPQNLLPFGGTALLYPSVFDITTANHYLHELEQEVPWRQEAIKIFGKMVMQPRLTAWYGDEGKAYSYSGIRMLPLPWSPVLLDIKAQVEACCGHRFNSALLNLYRNGSDSMGWHRDNEPELGPGPMIASLSLGAARRFRFRPYKEKKPAITLMLEHGSLLVMSGATQTCWEHQLPKMANLDDLRINITFRKITR